MRKLVFFVGGAGSGKTTLAKGITEKHPAVFLDMDTVSRRASEKIMTIAGHDPNDRDSPAYKELCRDLGYEMTMDVALENLDLNLDVFAVGPFTSEIHNPDWIREALGKIGASVEDVEVKVIYVYLSDMEQYKQRIIDRGHKADEWKLAHWDEFVKRMERTDVVWELPGDSILYFDNSAGSLEENIESLRKFVYGA
ncbi:AAA family ATPase [Saccharibacillus sp. CPCC 101409]|uniref:AAA family ATPase n=1 Tax=Saccharibacillus sp. CPCC 101409 TaxID=3058041 RepID=UPI002671470E|nr:ATP-binding protein [Saccharibacillus sp. CPCC 101409]MDO3408346.1 AAA family ATPase [Saccharibacillus sp. CPCC 101409]